MSNESQNRRGGVRVLQFGQAFGSRRRDIVVLIDERAYERVGGFRTVEGGKCNRCLAADAGVGIGR